MKKNNPERKEYSVKRSRDVLSTKTKFAVGKVHGFNAEARSNTNRALPVSLQFAGNEENQEEYVGTYTSAITYCTH